MQASEQNAESASKTGNGEKTINARKNQTLSKN